MSGFSFGARSKRNLTGVNADLVRVATRALELSPIDFTVTEGLRTVTRQRALVKSGASKTMNSRHITGHAIDVAPWVGGTIRWDWPLFIPIATAFQQAAEELKINIRWGGTWKLLNHSGTPSIAGLHKSFPDGPHFELPR
jgi:peptidoglycan L-alanyl-D-glutamate endopeptidase CwlK